MSVVSVKPDAKFEITPKNLENLPKIPKLLRNDENIQKRTFDIMNGTFKKGTKCNMRRKESTIAHTNYTRKNAKHRK